VGLLELVGLRGKGGEEVGEGRKERARKRERETDAPFPSFHFAELLERWIKPSTATRRPSLATTTTSTLSGITLIFSERPVNTLK